MQRASSPSGRLTSRLTTVRSSKARERSVSSAEVDNPQAAENLGLLFRALAREARRVEREIAEGASSIACGDPYFARRPCS